MSQPRVISLLPSATEIVAALGFTENLVGRSHECDFPRGVEKLPICSSTKIPVQGSSYEIDERVKQIVAEVSRFIGSMSIACASCDPI